jgi:hypothetical protein
MPSQGGAPVKQISQLTPELAAVLLIDCRSAPKTSLTRIAHPSVAAMVPLTPFHTNHKPKASTLHMHHYHDSLKKKSDKTARTVIRVNS